MFGLKGLTFNFGLFVIITLICLLVQTSTVAQKVSISDKPIGFCMLDGTTTGGGDAEPTSVSSLSELKPAVQGDSPRVVMVFGTIKTTDGGGYPLEIGSNKTVVGANKDATIYGGIAVKGVSNVIIRNLNFHGIYPNSGPDDAIAVRNSDHIWIDHCNIWDAGDGNLDITRESNYCTVSWCKFYYTNSKNGHRLCALIGSGGGDHPEDWGKLKVTYHHNWFGELIKSRMPRLMYGHGHIYNNYYTSKGNSYCIGVGSYGTALIENNYFKDVNDPHTFMYDVYSWITARGNVYKNTGGKKDKGKGGNRDVGVPGWAFPVKEFAQAPYEYQLDNAEDVPALVSQNTGPQEITTTHIRSTGGKNHHLFEFKQTKKSMELRTNASYVNIFIRIFSIDGKMVLAERFSKNVYKRHIEIPLNGLSRGIFLVKIQMNDVEESRRIKIL